MSLMIFFRLNLLVALDAEFFIYIFIDMLNFLIRSLTILIYLFILLEKVNMILDFIHAKVKVPKGLYLVFVPYLRTM